MRSEETTHPPEQRTCERDGCEQPVPESLGTRPRRYCRRSCRQRAYEARKQREVLAAAVASAVVRDRAARAVPSNVTVTPVAAAGNVTVTPAYGRRPRLLPPPPGTVRKA